MKRLLVGFVLLLVAACTSGQVGPLSPREQAAELMTRHTTVLLGVESVLSIPAVAQNRDLVEAIQRTSSIATAAVVSYVEAAKLCERQVDGTITGVGCNEAQTRLMLPIAREALLALQAELSRIQGGAT